jgi:hypothetical protein
MERLYEVYHLIDHAYKLKPLNSFNFTLSDNEKSMVKSYAEEPSNFDGDNYRQDMYATGQLSGVAIGMHIIYIIGHFTQKDMEAIKLWGHILQALQPLKQYIVYWFLSDEKRIFPSKGQKVGPTNINGGYCQACRPETIVIYRREDATRVFIHEMMHAACLDDHSRPLPAVEAETEAWAEVFYAMLMAKEYGLSPAAAWNIQSSWSSSQNKRLREDFGVNSPTDYAWRYTVGKEAVWRRWNLPVAPPQGATHSLALGAPEYFFGKSTQKH